MRSILGKSKKKAMRMLSILMVAALLSPLLSTDGIGYANAASNKKVKSVTIKKPVTSTLTMKKGSTYQLKVNVAPKNATNKKLAFRSKKKGVVSVNAKGRLTAKKTGKAVISVTAKDGSKKSASITVTVVNKLTKVKKVTLSSKSATLYVGGTAKEGKLALKPTFSPKKATTKKVNYTTSNKSVATVSKNGVVTAKKVGKATITAYAADGWGKKATCKVTVEKKEERVTPTPIITPTPTAKVTPTPTPDPIKTPSPTPTGGDDYTPNPVPYTTKTPSPTDEPKLDSENELSTTGFKLVTENVDAPKFYLDDTGEDYNGLKMVADSFAGDVGLMTGEGTEPDITTLPEDLSELSGNIIVAGSIGNNRLIDKWIEEEKIYIGAVRPYYETYRVLAVENPEENIDSALIIIGSDKRGTIYGIYHISEIMGVSPWVYWGDVKPVEKDEIEFTEDEINYTSKEPSVRYRGIFLNDEAPSLSTWVQNKFTAQGENTYNEKFYKHVFELILRLKGNYLWPAMWNNRFGTDGAAYQEANAVMANEYGVVMGTSHHEPMMRADKEWNALFKNSDEAMEKWNYATNKTQLDAFWNESAQKRKSFENVITLGMRGQGDTTMLGADSTVQENVDLLKNIILNQKRILKNNGLQDAPKVLTLYKEVEEYWYGSKDVQGLKDWDQLNDVTIMLAEDNFGNLRTLPTDSNRDRGPGWGMYYHFDYHGAPTSYEWVHTLQLEKTWEQMSMAYDYGVQDVWIVNVGDLKPMEMPISFFLDMAYDFDSWGTGNIDSAQEYIKKWVEQQFGGYTKGEQEVDDIVSILKGYTKLNGARKPEIVTSATYKIENYNEALKKLNELNELIELADQYYVSGAKELPQEAMASYFQLVYYPAVASANVHRIWIYKALMEYYGGQGRASANVYAELVKECLQYDDDLMKQYNKSMPGLEQGDKWDGMMSSAHIGYSSWEAKGAVDGDNTSGNRTTAKFKDQYEYIELPEEAEMLVVPQGSKSVYRGGTAKLPVFIDVNQEIYYIDIANGGGTAFDYTVTASEDWIVLLDQSGEPLASNTGTVITQDTIGVKVDYNQEITNGGEGTITLVGPEESEVTIQVTAKRVTTDGLDETTFMDTNGNGYISMEAAHFADSATGEGNAEWKEIKNYGKTLSSIKVWPTTARFTDPTKAPYVEYKVKIEEDGDYVLQTYVAPSNNVDWHNYTMRYGVSIDGGDIVVKDTIDGAIVSEIRNEKGDIDGTKFIAGNYYSNPWSTNVKDNVRLIKTEHEGLKAGVHTIRIYAVDPGLVLQKLVWYPKNMTLANSYFGPEESYYVGKTGESKLATDKKQEPIYAASCNIPATIDGEWRYDVIIPKTDKYNIIVETESAAPGDKVTIKRNGSVIETISNADEEGTFKKEEKELQVGRGTFEVSVDGSATIKNVKIILIIEVVIGDPLYVRSSSEQGEYYATNAYDGIKRTIWKANEGDVKPYLEFDFARTAYVDRIAIWESGKNVNAFEIQVYDKEQTGTAWKTVYEGEGISSGDTVFLQGKEAVRGQKLRIVFTDIEDAPAISEVALTPYLNWAMEDGGVQLKGYQAVSTSAELPSTPNMDVPEAIIDGNRITSAMEASPGSNTTSTPHVITLEFSEPRLVDRFNVISLQEAEYAKKDSGEVPNTTMKSNRAQRIYRVSYYDGAKWVLVGATNDMAEGEQKVFNTFTLDNPVETSKIKLEVVTSYWVRIVEFEANLTFHSSGVQDYAKTKLNERVGNEISLAETSTVGAIHFETTSKDATYNLEYAIGSGNYTVIEPNEISGTEVTENGIFLFLKEPIETDKVRITAPDGVTIGRIELWGITPKE